MSITLLLDERRYLSSPLLDSWLARGDRLEDQSAGTESLLRSVFNVDGPLAVAALTRQKDVGDAGDALWLRADPAWIRADLNSARMFAHGELGLSADDVAALTPDLSQLFAEHGFAFNAPTPTRWYLRCPDQLDLPAFADPDTARGDDLKLHMPPDAAGKRWRVLINDVQVMLHNHPVNERRIATGKVAVNSLWLWGGGRMPSSVASNASLYAGDDSVTRALASAALIPVRDIESLVDSIRAQSTSATSAILDLRHLRGDDLIAMLDRLSHNAARVNLYPVNINLASGERVLYRAWHRLRFWRTQ